MISASFVSSHVRNIVANFVELFLDLPVKEHEFLKALFVGELIGLSSTMDFSLCLLFPALFGTGLFSL